MRILEFLVAFALLVASFWAMALAFTPEFEPYAGVTFAVAIILVTLSFGLPMRRFLKA